MKQLVITTKSWQALIESLRANSKHGYNSLESLKHDDVYFTAVLCQGFDEFYVARLKVVIGTETDTEEYVDFLAANLVPFSSVQMVVEGPVQKEVVETKIKRPTRKPKEMKNERN